MRKAVVLLYVAILAGAGAVAAVSPQQRRELRHHIVGKRAVAGSVARAGVGTAFNSPHQWGRGPGGFAKRVGSGLARNAVKQTVQFGVAAAHHENLHYQRSNLHGKMPRLGYAVKSTFIVPRTNRRGKTVALGRVSGNLGAGVVSQAWMPAGTVGAGLASGGIGLGADVGANVAREFWPRHRKVRGK